jgi:hypothetical protein
MIVAIHQPNYLPYIGYFLKMARCDRFIVLDDVQYVRRGYVNRNRIKTPQGVQWLSVPVQVKGNYAARINEMIPCWESSWVHRHERTLEVNYRRAPYFDEVMDTVIRPPLEESEDRGASLADLNTSLIRSICRYLGIETPITLASQYGVESESLERLITLTTAAGGTKYLSGRGADKYQDPRRFADAGIELRYNDFVHPHYPQLWGRFEMGMSVVDFLFCAGRDAAEFFQNRAASGRAVCACGSPVAVEG